MLEEGFAGDYPARPESGEVERRSQTQYQFGHMTANGVRMLEPMA